MLEEMIQKVTEKELKKQLPHAALPGSMLAQITKAAPLEEYERGELKITDKDRGDTFEASVTGKWYEYNVQILTKDGAPDPAFPVIPGVRSKVKLEAGSRAAVVLLYGELRPYIIGEA